MFSCLYKLERLSHEDKGILGILRYNPNDFCLTKFDEERINLPASIKNSVQVRQAEFFAGRLAAKYALNDLINATPTVGIGQNREPLWPDGVVGSITHSRGLAAVQVKLDDSTLSGIDIEHPIDQNIVNQVKCDVLCQSECDIFERNATDSELYFRYAFSAKEALFKALYPKVLRYMMFSESKIVEFDSRKNQIEIIVNELDIQGRYLIKFHDFGIFVLSIVYSEIASE